MDAKSSQNSDTPRMRKDEKKNHRPRERFFILVSDCVTFVKESCVGVCVCVSKVLWKIIHSSATGISNELLADFTSFNSLIKDSYLFKIV